MLTIGSMVKDLKESQFRKVDLCLLVKLDVTQPLQHKLALSKTPIGSY
jgi:hypothetical protein